MNKVRGIEIQGIEELRKAFANVPKEIEASVIRNIARKPGNKIISLARHLLPANTGQSARSLGFLKISDPKQTFIELGIKGRSLAYIFMFWKDKERFKDSGASTGRISSPGNVIDRAARQLQNSTIREMKIDITRTIAKAFKRYAP